MEFGRLVRRDNGNETAQPVVVKMSHQITRMSLFMSRRLSLIGQMTAGLYANVFYFVLYALKKQNRNICFKVT